MTNFVKELKGIGPCDHSRKRSTKCLPKLLLSVSHITLTDMNDEELTISPETYAIDEFESECIRSHNPTTLYLERATTAVILKQTL